MKNPFRKGPNEEAVGLSEAEALKGKFRMENWRQSAEGRLDAETKLPPTEAVRKQNGDRETNAQQEDPVDTLIRELSVLSQGMGGLKTNYPITPQNRIAISEILSLAKYARRHLSPDNRGRQYIEDELLTLGDEIFTRSIGNIEPAVVYGEKPWIYPGAPPGALPAGQASETEARTKKAP